MPEQHMVPRCRFKSTYSLSIGGPAGSDIQKTCLEVQMSQVPETVNGSQMPEQKGGNGENPSASVQPKTKADELGGSSRERPLTPVRLEERGPGV